MNSGFVPCSSLLEAGCRRIVLDRCAGHHARRHWHARRATAGSCLQA
jgi:hypothetical protein